jgi:hypothetical protein
MTVGCSSDGNSGEMLIVNMSLNVGSHCCVTTTESTVRSQLLLRLWRSFVEENCVSRYGAYEL